VAKFQSDFTWHTNALAGNRGPITADEPMHGWYRQKNQRGEYEPVAYWIDSETGELRCHINGKAPRDPLRAIEVWPYASRGVISADDYWHRMDTGQWRDNDAGAIATAAGPDIDPATDPVGSLKAEIEKARAALPAYKTIDSDEQAAKAQTLRSALTGLAGKGTKAHKAEKAPHLEAGRAVDAKWFPPIRDAESGADELRKALSAWETIKLENQRRADEETRKRQEQAAREAEWAAADPGRVAPIDPPKVEPVKPNTPPPAMQIKGASGRAASVGVRKVVKSIDLDKCFQQFGGLPEVYNLFMALAQKAVDSGRDVPGAEIKEEANVK
jgi:hypothetical protein